MYVGAMEINAYAAPAAGRPVQPFRYEPGELGPGQVRVAVTHCGVCHSDVHCIDNDFGDTQYPLVAGHEIVGTVEALGPGVRHLAVGQRVGIGPYRATCLQCQWCTSGNENLCLARELTITNGNRGGFADAIQVDGAYAFAIPDALSSEAAAPLLCAGLTVFAPLRAHTRPSMRVGVIGIGGLGHLALRFASSMGCEVTAFSSSASKEEEARRLGAHHFVQTSDPAQRAAARGSIDFLLSTVYVDLDWMEYLGMLRPNGRICIVGASMGPINVPAALLIMGQHSIGGSAAGGRAAMQEMLQMAARHGITAQIEVAPMTELDAALDRVRKNDVRYRMVLKR